MKPVRQAMSTWAAETAGRAAAAKDIPARDKEHNNSSSRPTTAPESAEDGRANISRPGRNAPLHPRC